MQGADKAKFIAKEILEVLPAIFKISLKRAGCPLGQRTIIASGRKIDRPIGHHIRNRLTNDTGLKRRLVQVADIVNDHVTPDLVSQIADIRGKLLGTEERGRKAQISPWRHVVDNLEQGSALGANAFLAFQDLDIVRRQLPRGLPRRQVLAPVGNRTDLTPRTVEIKRAPGLIGPVCGIALRHHRALASYPRYGLAHGSDNRLRSQRFDLAERHARSDHVIARIAIENLSSHRLNRLVHHIVCHRTFNFDHHRTITGNGNTT